MITTKARKELKDLMLKPVKDYTDGDSRFMGYMMAKYPVETAEVIDDAVKELRAELEAVKAKQLE